MTVEIKRGPLADILFEAVQVVAHTKRAKNNQYLYSDLARSRSVELVDELLKLANPTVQINANQADSVAHMLVEFVESSSSKEEYSMSERIACLTFVPALATYINSCH